MRVVLIPVKKFSEANERLCGALGRSEREGLARAMLEDVLSNISQSAESDGAFVVTAEDEAMEMARGFGAGAIAERSQRSESASVEFGMRRCLEMGAKSALVVPGDIPLATAAEFDAVIKKGAQTPVVIVPSRDGTGSNAIMMTPPGALPLSFGEGSFSRHKKTAAELGLEFDTLTLEGIGLDIDAPRDLETFIGRGEKTAAYRYLSEIGAAARMAKRG